MALTRQKKEDIIADLENLFSDSKMTVFAKYEGVTVKQMQAFRRMAEDQDSVVKVAKNRLVKKAMSSSSSHKDADTSVLNQMLVYIFSTNDEVAGAQTVKAFVKESGASMEFVGAFDDQGKILTAEEVKTLSELPSREVQIATVVNTLQSPMRTVVGQLKGNLLGLMDALAAKAS